MEIKKIGFNLIISAPSGAGKSTLINKLLREDDSFALSISATTRKKRTGEQEGVDYYYKSLAEFLELVNNDAFLEHEEVFGNWYGTLKKDVDEKLNMGKNIIFDIDARGASNIKQKAQENSVLVYILPPSIAELEKRLDKRGTDSKDIISNRMLQAKVAVQSAVLYDYIIINDDLDNAYKELKAIVDSNKIKTNRFVNIKGILNNL
jgi:guanylate kinase